MEKTQFPKCLFKVFLRQISRRVKKRKGVTTGGGGGGGHENIVGIEIEKL